MLLNLCLNLLLSLSDSVTLIGKLLLDFIVVQAIFLVVFECLTKLFNFGIELLLSLQKIVLILVELIHFSLESQHCLLMSINVALEAFISGSPLLGVLHSGFLCLGELASNFFHLFKDTI